MNTKAIVKKKKNYLSTPKILDLLAFDTCVCSSTNSLCAPTKSSSTLLSLNMAAFNRSDNL